jgi:hypothetical protein
MLMLLMKRSRVTLDRDIILVAEAGEESATEAGIDFSINQCPTRSPRTCRLH